VVNRTTLAQNVISGAAVSWPSPGSCVHKKQAAFTNREFGALGPEEGMDV
jgi:hypothetical protein